MYAKSKQINRGMPLVGLDSLEDQFITFSVNNTL